MQNTFWTAFATSLAAALVTSLGIFVIRYFSRWGSRNTTYFMYFAAGVLISSSFLHIVPRALSMNAQAPAWLLAGFFGLHLSNRFLAVFNCDKEPGKKDYVFGLVPMLGIGLHSFIDGFIYSVTFSVSILTGYLASLGMVLHEFPEGMITYLLLLRAGFNERSSAVLAFLAAAATTPLGMLVSYPFISAIAPSSLGVVLALSAGALIYVGATHLLPRAEQEHRKYGLFALGGGVLVAAIIVASKA
ncbi:zinc transporter, ZIP family [Modicisalibacter ilicicola DSM 19980]|uniref:Zinc transporter, ZIP family n=1 Tax=Modicisalibacter ilicicola DSM 19980 TaxID=1121942 RepID=A0A1M4SJP2_9GAMM|nr:ZIP family metal transporter [Halomonas ilicicola]SHE32411.1 zinc transporter, ZIP family [Halomonas ilicicola DSM 19980]